MSTSTNKITFKKARKDLNKVLDDVIDLRQKIDFFDLENKKEFDCNIDAIEAYLRETKMIVIRDEEYRRVMKFLNY